MFGKNQESIRHLTSFTKGGVAKLAALSILAVGIACYASPAAAQQPGQKTFPSPTEATKALVEAVKSNDQQALEAILGADSKDILSSGDEVQDKNDRDDFIQKYQQMHRLVNEPDGTTTLYIGAENFPTPIPLVGKDNVWFFDTAAGKQEILYRRIGRNELAVIQLCHELVDAQKEYYAKPHDGDSGRHYARKFFSDPNKHNGLYWEQVSGEGESPIGPLVAAAASEGYVRDSDQKQQPFQGYYFQILKIAPNTSAGAGSDAAPGKMAGGFAFLAYPAEYRSSGVMTFIVDQNGIVYEKDLGRRTTEIAKALTRYNRDATWRKAD